MPVLPTTADNSIARTLTVTSTGLLTGDVVRITDELGLSTTLVTTFVSSTVVTAVVPALTGAGIYDVAVLRGTTVIVNFPAAFVLTNLLVSDRTVGGMAELFNPLPNYYSRNPKQVAVLNYNASGYIWIEGGQLRIAATSSTTNLQFDLTARQADNTSATILDLYLWMYQAGYSPTILDSRYRLVAALALLDLPKGGQGAGGILYAHHSILWRYLTTVRYALGGQRTQLAAAQAQLELATAGGYWLDLWGDLVARSRWGGEDDDTYRRRLIVHLAYAYTNNQSLTLILSNGYNLSPQVTDTAPGQFLVKYGGIPAGYTISETVATTRRVVDRYKAAGTIYDVRVFDTIALQDSVLVNIVERFDRFGIPISKNTAAATAALVNITEQVSLRPGKSPRRTV